MIGMVLPKASYLWTTCRLVIILCNLWCLNGNLRLEGVTLILKTNFSSMRVRSGMPMILTKRLSSWQSTNWHTHNPDEYAFRIGIRHIYFYRPLEGKKMAIPHKYPYADIPKEYAIEVCNMLNLLVPIENGD